jgi:ABC-type branched-subunit amino acid transport system substrate-binding protein
MNQSTHRRPRRWTFSLLVVLALVATACGSDSDSASEDVTDSTVADSGDKVELTGVPGVTDDEIRFAAIGTDSNNPTGQCYLTCYLHGVQAYFDYRNSEGGIYGRKLVIDETKHDDELGKVQQKAIEIVAADEAFGVFQASIIAGSGYDEFLKGGWPVYTYLTDPPQGTKPNIMGSPALSCVECTRSDGAWTMKTVGATKAAILAYNVGSSGTCGKSNADSIKKHGPSIGGASVGFENRALQYGLPNGVGPEVSAIKESGATVVFTCFDENGTKAVARELVRQGLSDVTIYHSSNYNPTLWAAESELFENDIAATTIRTTGKQRELANKWIVKAGGTKYNEISMHGWVTADMAYQALKGAGPEFSRKKVIDAANELEDFTADGLTAPYDVGRQRKMYTETDRSTGPQPWCRILYRIKKGKATIVKPATDDKPFICWPGTTSDWSEPQAYSFD